MRRFVVTFACLCCLLFAGAQARVFCREAPPPGPAAEQQWRELDSLAGTLSPTWQRRYMEIKFVAGGVHKVQQQMAVQLATFDKALLEVQKNATALLVELAPARDDAAMCNFLVRALEEQQWDFTLPFNELTTLSDTLDSYARILHDMDDSIRTAFAPARVTRGAEFWHSCPGYR